MNEKKPNLSRIPDLEDILQKYGTTLKNNPQFVLVGEYRGVNGKYGGILAAANNEFHAYILKREINKSGNCRIERSEYHPDGATFSIELYRRRIRQASS
jgi:hypothetical protein